MNVFENQTSTRATVVIVKCYENHANDSRVTEEPDVSQTLNRRMGTGGGQSSYRAYAERIANTETKRTTYSIEGGRCTTHCQR